MSVTRNEVSMLARKAILQMLEPMAEFAVDAGLSTADVCALLREDSVRSIANRKRQTSSRVNISGIAATTGISRAEISRILKHQNARPGQKLDRPQQSTNRILAAWHSEAKFADANGQPVEPPNCMVEVVRSKCS